MIIFMSFIVLLGFCLLLDIIQSIYCTDSVHQKLLLLLSIWWISIPLLIFILALLVQYDDENFINLEENWENRSHLDAYFCSDVFSALLGAMKLLGKDHGIRINGGPPEDGMAAVEHARKK